MDERGHIVATYGDGDRMVTYPRSAIKMMQALSFVESGAYHKWDLDQRHLSIACASHNGEPAHTELVMSWLQKIQCQEDDLVCGAHAPYDEVTWKNLLRNNQAPSRRHNNCSGKHTSMLCTMKTLNIDMAHYGSYDHELQVRLRRIVGEVSDENLDRAPWGGDGCGIPTYAMSLHGMAQGFRRFLPDQQDVHVDRQTAIRLVREAVIAQPYFIGGSSDFCSEVMKLTDGRLLVKSGAEGVYAGALLEQGLSFALKVRDGNPRAVRVAASALLRDFKGLRDDEFLRLSHHTQPDVKNWEGQTVGKIFVPHPLMS